VPAEGIEPPTFGLQNRCSTAELSRHSVSEQSLSKSNAKLKPECLPIFYHFWRELMDSVVSLFSWRRAAVPIAAPWISSKRKRGPILPPHQSDSSLTPRTGLRRLLCCPYGGIDLGHRVLLHSRQDMAVEIERDPDLAVSQPLAGDLRMHSLL
jgi:hypothetical protein